MTVSASYAPLSYVGNDVSTSFPVTWPFFEAADLIVTERLLAAPYTESTKVLDVDYTVTITSPDDLPSVGSVEAMVAPAATVEWVIERRTPDTQESDYVNTAAFQPETVEGDQDRSVLRHQEIRHDLARALHAPGSDEAAIDMELPSEDERASQYLGFDAAGEPVALAAPAGTTSVSVYGASLILAANAAAARVLLTTERVAAGTIAARPAASTFGRGFYHATDIDQLFYSDASAWTPPLGIGQFANGSLPAAAAANAGALYLDTTFLRLLRSDGSALQVVSSELPDQGQVGCLMEWNGIAAMSLTAGRVRATGDHQDLVLAALLSKTVSLVDEDWEAGSGNNFVPSVAQGVGLVANTKLRVFQIGGPTVATDFGVDTDASAANLLAAAQAVDAGYTRFRRRGWVQINSGGTGILEWIQDAEDPDTFYWEGPQIGWDDAAADQDYSGAGGVLRTMAGGFPSTEIFGALAMSGAGAGSDLVATRPGRTLVEPNYVGGNIGSFVRGSDSAVFFHSRLDGSAQLQIKSDTADATIGVHISIHGWRDRRLF